MTPENAKFDVSDYLDSYEWWPTERKRPSKAPIREPHSSHSRLFQHPRPKGDVRFEAASHDSGHSLGGTLVKLAAIRLRRSAISRGQLSPPSLVISRDTSKT
jgi:hypothetical protein